MSKVLTDAADWEAHRLAVARTNGVHPDCVGGTPEDYPCKAMTAVVETITGKRFLTAFFYPQDARDLLEAMLPTGAQANPADPARGSQPTDRAKFEEQQARFNTQISAQLLAIIYLMRATGICKPDAFEQLYNEGLSFVDEVATERRVELLQRMEAEERSIERKTIERLFPPAE